MNQKKALIRIHQYEALRYQKEELIHNLKKLVTLMCFSKELWMIKFFILQRQADMFIAGSTKMIIEKYATRIRAKSSLGTYDQVLTKL